MQRELTLVGSSVFAESEPTVAIIGPSTESLNRAKNIDSPLPKLFSITDEDKFPGVNSSTSVVRPLQTESCFAAPSALEAIPHVVAQVIKHWGTRELNTFIHQILLDTRDGSRQGFPIAAAQELMFLAEINLLVRALDTAPLLQITVDESCELIARGDQAALGHATAATDIWATHYSLREKSRAFHPSPLSRNFQAHPHNGTAHSRLHGKAQHPAPHRPSPQPSALLNESPPVPPSVRVDLTTPKPLRPENGATETGDIMEWGFFQCIAKELGCLKLKRLVLSNLGNSEKCNWLAAAIRFSKNRCHIAQVVLHVDLLSAPDWQLSQAMSAGLDQLVVNFNMASGKWCTAAEKLTQTDPDYFQSRLERLIKMRDVLAEKTGHQCLISVVETGRRHGHFLHQIFAGLSRQAGVEPFQWQPILWSTPRYKDEMRAAEPCHCWAPFIEAHIRTNGHLVACAQDYSGYSFAADLKQVTFVEAWLSHSFRKTRQRVLLGEKPGRLCEICHHRVATP